MPPNDNTVDQTKRKRSKLQAHLIRPEGGYIREGGWKAQGWDDALMHLGTPYSWYYTNQRPTSDPAEKGGGWQDKNVQPTSRSLQVCEKYTSNRSGLTGGPQTWHIPMTTRALQYMSYFWDVFFLLMIGDLRAGKGYTKTYFDLTEVHPIQWIRVGNHCLICKFVANQAEPDSSSFCTRGAGCTGCTGFTGRTWIACGFGISVRAEQKPKERLADFNSFATPSTSTHWPYGFLKGGGVRDIIIDLSPHSLWELVVTNDSGGVRGVRGVPSCS